MKTLERLFYGTGVAMVALALTSVLVPNLRLKAALVITVIALALVLSVLFVLLTRAIKRKGHEDIKKIREMHRHG